MVNYNKLKNELSDLEKEVLLIFAIAEEYLYAKTIARVLKKDQKDVDVAIEKLLKKGLLK